MTDWRTIRIPEEVFQRHNRNRKELGVTWAEYMDSEAPEYTLAEEIVTISRDELRKIVRNEIQKALHEAAR